MKVLEEFWYGNINPMERPFQSQRKFDKVFRLRGSISLINNRHEKSLQSNPVSFFSVVRMTGLEPAHRRHQNLNLARLPIPPHPHIKFLPLDFYTGEVTRGGAYRLILIYENGKTVINNKFTYRTDPKSGASANSATPANIYLFIKTSCVKRLHCAARLPTTRYARCISSVSQSGKTFLGHHLNFATPANELYLV